MDPKPNHPLILAPGASSSSSLYCPGPERLRPDEHIAPVEDEERIEIIDGLPVSAMSGAHPEHAGPQAQLAAVLHAAVAPGYHAMVELLTRCDADNDFATDASIVRAGTDPETGGRYVEDLAFEVINEQAPSLFFKKAQRLSRRGVRRIFAVLVKKGQVVEWSRDHESFEFLHADGAITDPCLRVPLSVKALLDGAEADDAVAGALLAKGNRTLARREASVRQEAEASVRQEALLTVLAARGLAIPEDIRARVLSTTDMEALGRWLARAAVAVSLAEMFEP